MSSSSRQMRRRRFRQWRQLAEQAGISVTHATYRQWVRVQGRLRRAIEPDETDTFGHTVPGSTWRSGPATLYVNGGKFHIKDVTVHYKDSITFVDSFNKTGRS